MFSCQTNPGPARAKELLVGGLSSQSYVVTAIGYFTKFLTNITEKATDLRHVTLSVAKYLEGDQRALLSHCSILSAHLFSF